MENIKGKDEGVNSSECKLSDKELVSKVYDWVKRLCGTGGRAWALKIPADLKNDPDILISELAKRFESLSSVDREEGWISVEERKPEKDKKVWVAFGDKDVDEGMYVDWDGGQVVFVDAVQKWRYVFQPTHWKPFIVPSPPINNKS